MGKNEKVLKGRGDLRQSLLLRRLKCSTWYLRKIIHDIYATESQWLALWIQKMEKWAVLQGQTQSFGTKYYITFFQKKIHIFIYLIFHNIENFKINTASEYKWNQSFSPKFWNKSFFTQFRTFLLICLINIPEWNRWFHYKCRQG